MGTFKNKLKKNKLPISCLCSIYEKTLKEEFSLSILSLLCQEYIPNQIVVVIDGEIPKKLEEYINLLKKIYPEIIISVKIKVNVGLGSALNYGLEFCKNNFVARFDTDDINLKDRLKIQYEYFLSNRKIDVLGSYVKEFKNDNVINSKIKKVPLENDEIYSSIYKRNPFNHPTVMFKKKEILKCGSYIDMKNFEDYHLWIRCKKNFCKFGNINKALVAMKKDDIFIRRHGKKYFKSELNFLKDCLRKKIIEKKYIIIFIFRLLIRLIPIFALKRMVILDLQRNRWAKDYELEEYIINLKKIADKNLKLKNV